MPSFLNRKYTVAVFILAVMAVGFWLRAYNHHDWLYFKMDQARDAAMVGKAIENGPGELPLLGPRAGATEVSAGFLRLGPAYYYFQYLSGKIFNSVEPPVFAYPDLFFSILTIPLLYLFLRFYFSKLNSFLIMLMYAFSFIAIQYARFAWNPNSLLFFALLNFYGLLNFLRTDNFKKKIFSAVLAAIGIGVGSQLHFLGVFCLPTITAFVLLTHFSPWKKIFAKKKLDAIEQSEAAGSYSSQKSLAYVAVFIVTLLVVYSPVVVSDAIRGGENARSFVEAFSTKPNDKKLSVKFERSMDKQTKYYCLVAFSECYKGKTEDNRLFGFLAAMTILAGLALAIRNIVKHKDRIRNNFLWLLIAWFGIFYILAIPLYSSLRPRFFIPVFPLPFIFLGLIFVFIKEQIGRRGKYLAIIITAFIVGMNLKGTLAWFSEQEKSQLKDTSINRTLILKNQDGVTLAQLEKAVDYMYENREPDAPLVYYVKQEHFSPVKYLLSLKKDSELSASRVEKENDAVGPYFAVIPSEKNNDYVFKEFGEVKILDSKKAGQISVYKIQNLNPKPKFAVMPDNSEASKSEAVKADRVFWRDIFGNSKNNNVEIDESGSDDLESEKEDD